MLFNDRYSLVRTVNEQVGDVSLTAADVGAVPRDKVPNPNLLDNWCFCGPAVDQHRSSRQEYVYSDTAGKYIIDRWFATVTAVDSSQRTVLLALGLDLSGYDLRYPFYIVDVTGPINNSNGYQDAYKSDAFCQYLDRTVVNSILGKTVTLSVLLDRFSAGAFLYTMTVTAEANDEPQQRTFSVINENDKFTLCLDLKNRLVKFISERSPAGVSRGFIAAKLEIGSEQTLVHTDLFAPNSTGALVCPNNYKAAAELYEFQNYGNELAKCQRYYYSVADLSTVSSAGSRAYCSGYASSTTTALLYLPIPNQMPPSKLSLESDDWTNFVLIPGNKAVSNIALAGVNQGSAMLTVTSSGLTTGASYILSNAASKAPKLALTCEELPTA